MAVKKEAKEAEVVTEGKTKKTSTKTVKKDAAKTAKVTTDTVKDLRELNEQELQTALKTAREDLLTAQKMLHANELPSSHVIRKTKKLIARIHTVLNERSENE